MRDAFVAAVHEIAAADPSFILVTGDLGFGVLSDYAETFPDQYLNAGIAEQNMTGMAAGMALAGRRVFTYSIANFPTLRCLEQIRNDMCYHDLNVTVVAVGGGLSYGPLGFSHQATEDLAIMRALPNMTVIAPGHDTEAGEATHALAAHDGPSYLRLDRSAPLPDGLETGRFELGRVAVMRDLGGADVLMVTTGAMLRTGLEVAEKLSAEGVGTRLVAVPTMKPFDVEGWRAQLEDRPELVVTLEEHSAVGGLGSVIAEASTHPGLNCPAPRILRKGLPDELPNIVGSQDYLRRHYALDAESIVAEVLALRGQEHG